MYDFVSSLRKSCDASYSNSGKAVGKARKPVNWRIKALDSNCKPEAQGLGSPEPHTH